MVKNTGKKTVVVRSLKAVRDTALGYLFVYQWYSEYLDTIIILELQMCTVQTCAFE